MSDTVIRNGELRDIQQRLVRLETTSDERWRLHDRASAEMWLDIKKKLESIFKKIEILSDRKYLTIREAREYTNMLVAWVVGIPFTIGSLIVIFKFIMLANS